MLSYHKIRKGYPTEKPVDLMEVLVTQSTTEGQLVIDPFMGSGSVGAACLNTGRRFMGCDISTKAVTHTKTRLESILKSEE